MVEFSAVTSTRNSSFLLVSKFLDKSPSATADSPLVIVFTVLLIPEEITPPIARAAKDARITINMVIYLMLSTCLKRLLLGIRAQIIMPVFPTGEYT